MPTKSDKPKFGDLVESNPNHQKLKQALEQHLSGNEELGDSFEWPLPKAFAEMYDFCAIDSDSFCQAYYKLRHMVKGEHLSL